MKILAFDLATRVGFAYADGPGEPHYGFHQIADTGEDLGMFLVDFRSFAMPLIDRVEPDLIVYEGPIEVFGNNPWAARKLHVLGGKVEEIAWDAGIPVEEQTPGPVRSYFLGKGNTPKGSVLIKAAVMAKCFELGWNPRCNDVADALALLAYFRWLKRLVRIPNGPAFREDLPRAQAQ